MHASQNHLFIRMIFYINMIFTITATHFEHMDSAAVVYQYTNNYIGAACPAPCRSRHLIH